jgi:hypothetical protein
MKNNCEITFIKNFICTKKDRLDLLKKNLPHFAKIINPYPVLINYDTDIYYDEIKELYENHIENLHFQKKMNLDWAEVTNELLDMSTSPYISYLTEDIVFHSDFNKEHFQSLFEEFKYHNCEHMMMGKVDKYTYKHNHKYSKKGDYLWHFHSTKSPTMFNNGGRGVISLVGLYKRSLFKKCLNKVIGKGKGLSGMHVYEILNVLEGTNMNFSTPNQSFFTEVHPNDGTTEHGVNQIQGFTS